MSLRLVHTFGRHAGTVQTVDKDLVRLGRAPDGDVVFDAEFDRDASGNHAEIRREGPGYLVLDLKSRNGTFVNGERVERRSLSTGDEITFGTKGPRVRVEFGPPLQRPVAGTGTVPAPPASPSPGLIPPEHRPPGWSASRGMPAGKLSGGPMSSAVAAPPAGQRVGQKTIAALISSAVATARGQSQSQQMDTKQLAAYVDKQVGQATKGQRNTTLLLAVLLLGALGAIGGLVWYSQQSSDQIDELRTKLANLPPNDPRRVDIEKDIGKRHPLAPSFGRTLYDTNKKGILMLAAGGQGFCTAFAIRPSVLATNAHCVVAAQHAGGNVVALENEGKGTISFPVVDMHAHPAYRDNDANSLTPDVGIVNINGKATTVLTIASQKELADLSSGDVVGLIGFPGRLMDPSTPIATFLGAHIGRVTNAKGKTGSFADMWLVQHDAPTTHGTSGSPIFNNAGHVVAVNAGGYLESDTETVAGRKTEVVKGSPYKFGMRIDLVNTLLR